MKREELLKRTKKELLALAGEMGVRLSSKLRKAELVAELLALHARRHKPGKSGKESAAPAMRRVKSPPSAPRSPKPAPSASKVVAVAPDRAASAGRGQPAERAPARPAASSAIAPRDRAERPAPASPASLGTGATRPAAGPESRAHLEGLDPADIERISAEISRHFPLPFERTEIVFYEIDPFHGHVFWHVRIDEMEAARRALGPEGQHAPLLLRFYDVTWIDFNGFNAHSFFDVAVHSLQSNYYVDFWESGRSYVVDIGLRLPDGHFSTLARSNHIELPRHVPSGDYDRSGVVVDPRIRIICEVADVTRAQTLADIRPEPNPEMAPETSDDLVRSFYVQLTSQGLPASPPPRRRASTSGPAENSQPAGKPSGETAEAALQTSPGVRRSRRRIPSASAMAWNEPSTLPTTEFEDADEVSRSGEDPPHDEGRDVPQESVRAQSEWKKSASLSSFELGLGSAAVSSWVTSPGAGRRGELALERVFTLPPEELRAQGKLVEINAELVIQGRARPGTQFSLLGQPVRLRPDGTFSVRRRLPDGTMIVPLFESPEGTDPAKGGGAPS